MDPDRLDRLTEKIERERGYKEIRYFYPGEQLNIQNKKTETKEDKILNLIKELEFLKKLLRLIERGATGFEMAFELERCNKIKKIIYNGIMFYNTFTEIGEQVFLEAPDKKEKDYHIFKTVENTEKFMFMVWLREEITNRDKFLKKNVDNSTLVKLKQEFIRKTKFCKNCGEEIKDLHQDICESCGAEIKIEW